MNDLIDRQVANEYFDLYRHSVLSTDEITSMIPTAVLNVVRCRDCKYNSLNRVSGNVFCSLGIGLSQIYDFCSYGVRKDD